MKTSSVGHVLRALDVAEPASRTTASPYSRLHYIEEHNHSTGCVYPTLANGVLVESDAAVWTLGTLVEVVPASTITDEYDIHHITIESITVNDDLELVLFQGAGDVEITRIRFVKNAVQSSTLAIPCITPLIPANARIRAAVASAAGGTDCTISLMYHTY